MPEKTERDAWWLFMNGNPEHEWNIPKRPKKRKRVWNEETQRYVRTDEMDQYEVSYATGTADEMGTSENIQSTVAEETQSVILNEHGEILEHEPSIPNGATGVKVEDNSDVEALLPTPFATPQPEVLYKKSSKRRHPTSTLLTEMDSVSS